MKVAHSVCEVLRDHVVLESECIDRMYLNVYVPQLQRVSGVVWYLRGHLGQRFASTAGVAPKTEAFVAETERFVAERGRNLHGEDIIWIDYDAAVSMHRVRATKPSERRLERLASPTPRDNRISYGCINVPAAFYDQWLAPLVMKTKPIVYVLPEERTGRAVAQTRPDLR